MNVGLFLAIEGIDGAGKTSLARLLKQELQKQGKHAAIISHRELRYDQNSYLGIKLAALESIIWGAIDTSYMNEVPPTAWVHILAAWYTLISRHFIEPYRANGYIVISDSWIYKRIARFSLKKEIDLNHVTKCFSYSSKPDLTVLLEIPPVDAWRRRREHPPKDLGVFDGYTGPPMEAYIQYQQEIHTKLQNYAKANEWHKLDSRQEMETLSEIVLELLNRRSTSA